MEKIKLLLTVLVLIFCLNLKGQINQDCDGQVGFGSVTNPQMLLELEDQEWMMFRASSNTTGIVFYETGGISGNTVRYGGRIEYDEDEDAIVIGSYENWNKKNGIYVNRQTGGVGIGYNLWGTTYAFKVHGRAITTHSVWETSDSRFKEKIENLKNEPNLLKQLRGVSYKRKQLAGQTVNYEADVQNSAQTATNNISSQNSGKVKLKKPVVPEREYGFIAQEVREIFPDLVIEDEEGYLAINYTGVIPLLVEAYKNLQVQVEYLENKLNDCCQESNLKSASLLSGNEESLSKENNLYQNTPNPFSVSTTIRYSLTKNVNNAMINVYNMNGTQLKSIELHQKENGDIIINGGEFNAGMYLYSLIADGQLIDTKRMVLTD